MNVYICTEGSQQMGLGHVYRTITLAREIPGKVTFVTTSGRSVVDKIEDSGFPVLVVKDEAEVLRILGGKPRGVVIIDRLEIDPDFARRVRDIGHSLVLFGNLSQANAQAQLVVNIIGTDFRNSRCVDPVTGTRYFQGPRYYIFKRSFFQHRSENLTPEKGRVLVMFGGIDPLDLTSRAFHCLSSAEGIEHLDLVVGAGYEHYRKLLAEVQAFPGRLRVELQRDVEDVAALMARASLVITSPGMSMFEALFMRRKVLAIAQVPFHDQLFSRDFHLYHAEDIPRLQEILRSGEFINPEDESIRKMEIGEGRDDIVKAIADLRV